MTLFEEIDLVEGLEAGRISREDPRYVALVQAALQNEAQKLGDVLTKIRSGQFGTHKDIVEHYFASPAQVKDWKRKAQRSGQMSEAEWTRHLARVQRKRKAKNHDRAV